ncbi:hypothetical protein [Sorangium cellulosum]|uniref:Uncharacterized protein n=1 Tax=Sorangium cellulosum So0157-2 TaxID=1254432 RepID=S4Y431_SORCE|nr:hypothetical protein [Sorangium cellulosum]AGP37673.1 hypothetical protein SCE1572_26265 [Sorangium cellulosum So0157-2]
MIKKRSCLGRASSKAPRRKPAATPPKPTATAPEPGEASGESDV